MTAASSGNSVSSQTGICDRGDPPQGFSLREIGVRPFEGRTDEAATVHGSADHRCTEGARSRRVARELTAPIARLGEPRIIVSDNRNLWHFIEPRKPVQNGFYKNFTYGFVTNCSTRACFATSIMRARRDNPAPTPTELLSSLQKLENFQADCVKRRTVADTARHVLHGPVKAALAQRHRTVERSLAPPPNRARHIRLCYIRTKRFDPIPGIRQLQAFGCGHQRDIRRDTPVPGSRACFAVVNAAPVLGAALLPTSWRRSHPIRREAMQPRDGTCSGDMPACPRARCRRRPMRPSISSCASISR